MSFIPQWPSFWPIWFSISWKKRFITNRSENEWAFVRLIHSCYLILLGASKPAECIFYSSHLHYIFAYIYCISRSWFSMVEATSTGKQTFNLFEYFLHYLHNNWASLEFRRLILFPVFPAVYTEKVDGDLSSCATSSKRPCLNPHSRPLPSHRPMSRLSSPMLTNQKLMAGICLSNWREIHFHTIISTEPCWQQTYYANKNRLLYRLKFVLLNLFLI